MSDMHGGPQTPSAPVTPTAPAANSQVLSPIMKFNISVIAAVGAISILLMLFGEFEDKGLRIFSTLLLFGFFALFTTLDSRQVKPLYMYIGQLANVYMLVLGLVLVWWTLALPQPGHHGYYDNIFYFDSRIVFYIIMLAGIIKLAVFLIQLSLRSSTSSHNQLAIGAKVTSFGVGVTAFLGTLPLGLEPFIKFGEAYSRIAIAALLFTVLSLAITAMIYWFFKEKTPIVNHYGAPNTQVPAYGAQNVPQGPQSPQPSPYPGAQPFVPQNASQGFVAAPQQPAAPLPWPLFPNGQPLPANANGQPDFAALHNYINNQGN